jgi:hypothetical protein
MLNEDDRREVWEEWLGAEMRAYYFADYCQTYHWRQRAATFLTLVLTSGATAAFLGRLALPGWVPGLLTMLAASVSLYSLVAQNVKAAIDCSDLHFRWNQVARDYRALWREWDSLENIRDALKDLHERCAEISKSGTPARYDQKRMLRWYDHVISHRVPAQA